MFASVLRRFGCHFAYPARCLSHRSEEEERIVNLLKTEVLVENGVREGPVNTEGKPWELFETKIEKVREKRRKKKQTVTIYTQQTGSDAFNHFEKLNPNLQKKLNDMYKKTLDIQDQVLPLALDGKSIVFQSATGTGKTLAFTVPVVNELVKKSNNIKVKYNQKHTKYLIVNPTRELCYQTYGLMSQLCPDITKVLMLGAFQQKKELQALLEGVPVVIGTPGKINEYIMKGFMDLSYLNMIVVDECDRMFEEQFFDQIEHIFKFAARGRLRQILLSSATVPDSVPDTVRKYVKDLNVISNDTPITNLRHICCVVPAERRTETLIHLLKKYSREELPEDKRKQAIVFVARKKVLLDLQEVFQSEGIANSEVLHADLTQSKREGVVKGFREGSYNILITTDIASRGLDIPECELSIQVQPRGGEDMYLHRAGRAGRAGREAQAYTLIVDRDRDDRELIKAVREMVPLEIVDALNFLPAEPADVSSLLEHDTQHVDNEASWSLDVDLWKKDLPLFESAIEVCKITPIDQTHIKKKNLVGLWFTTPEVARAAKAALRLHYIHLGVTPPAMTVFHHRVRTKWEPDWDGFYKELRRRKRSDDALRHKEDLKYFKWKAGNK